MLYQHSSVLFPLSIVVGVILGLIYIFKNINKLNLDKKSYERLIVIFSYAGIAFYIGASFFDDLFHYLNGEGWGSGGITFLGGMVSAVTVLITLYLIFMKPLRAKFFKIINIVSMGIILGHVVGRIGCFCAGCCYGEITDSKIGVVFPGDADLMKSKNGIYRIEIHGSDGYKNLYVQELNRLGYDANKIYTDYNEINYYYTTAKIYADNTKLLPTQLIETVFLLALFVLLFIIKHYQMPLYVIGYGIFRFLIEYKRFDNRGSTTLGISPSQLLSIIIIIFGFVLIGVYYYLNKKKQIEI